MLIIILILLPVVSNAAKCKVDGIWYPYSHPMCSTKAPSNKSVDSATLSSSKNKSSRATSGQLIVSQNSFGCTDRDYREKLTGALAQEDIQAFKKGLALGIQRGECTILKNGTQVFITDTAIFSGLVQVRQKGDLNEYWTNIEAVR